MGNAFDFESTRRHLAENLRRLRAARGLTQAALASAAEVPRSSLANLEADGGNPTLAILGRLAAALRITIEELLSAPHAGCRVYRNGTLPIELRGPQRGARVHRLLPSPVAGMEIDRFELRPRARMKGVPHRAGTREYLYCERGLLTVWAAGERFDLEAGDLATFNGDQPHSYGNNGEGTAVGFSVVAFERSPELTEPTHVP